MNPEQLNGAALAYMGDAIYETYVRAHVLASGKTQANRLHRAAIKYVEAAGQAYAMQAWIAQEDFLSDQEIDMYRRGRNHKANTKAKNASIQDYRQATGFEALLGWLFLSQQEERLSFLIHDAIERIERRGQDESKA
ncbi:Mini-ribonuclease 3 [Fundicoccus culcitae]|uniref:Mini-ribonuclease 3 n=1 Tax=Fundicoccus culcitae TaxID=2969821 RepID=A0ABY5P2T2_9LACT|nr:ribonuclease III domain-containing protein [Fundicoccus culcitae]UUX33041.1 ribonuclease III [Fundicoccus culcitae]